MLNVDSKVLDIQVHLKRMKMQMMWMGMVHLVDSDSDLLEVI